MSKESKHDYVELTAEMLDEVTGGSIYYNADGSPVDGKCKYKITGIMKNGQYATVYTDDYQEAIIFCENSGISKDLIQIG